MARPNDVGAQRNGNKRAAMADDQTRVNVRHMLYIVLMSLTLALLH